MNIMIVVNFAISKQMNIMIVVNLNIMLLVNR